MTLAAVQSDACAPDLSDQAFVAADIGGTHARLGLVAAEKGGLGFKVLAYQTYKCAQWASLTAILQEFIKAEVRAPVSHCVLAIAGVPIDGHLVTENLPWPVSTHELRRALGLHDIAIVNDFFALATAVRSIGDEVEATLTEARSPTHAGPRVVVGPGTGLGAAVLVPHAPKPLVLSTEAGQVALAPRTATEREVLALLARGDRHVSSESILSGPGLYTLYRSLATLHGVTPRHVRPNQITDAARSGEDPLASEAVHTFCAWLGSYVGDLAMVFNAGGGVYLAGGVLAHLSDILPQTAFVERFLDKGSLRAFLEKVPVHLIDHGRLGVIGAADWYFGRGA